MLTPRIKTALRFCPDLPTPPGIAMQIVELARDPEVELSVLVDLLAQDPALAGRLMRASNSCLFARRRKSESLRQAIVVIGLNATMTLALSFSLAQTLRNGRNSAEGVERSWRRVLMASCAARLIGDSLSRRDNEELALAALLQDIGVLALCAAVPEEYSQVLDEARDHDELVRLERERLGTDHGEAGSWLMTHWQLPEKLVGVPLRVHGCEAETVAPAEQEFYAIVEVAGKVADLLLGEDTGTLTEGLVRCAAKVDGLERETLESVLTDLAERIPEMAELYETEIISETVLVGIVDQARQVLAEWTLMEHRAAHQYGQHCGAASAGAVLDAEHVPDAAPAEAPARDQTAEFDERLGLEFRRATALGYPLSLAFVRLDDHDQLVQTHGANAIESALATLRRRLAGVARRSDLVFPSAGDEFVVLLPGMSHSRSQEIMQRLRKLTAGEQLQNAREEPFHVTLTIGLACHMDESQLYASAIELLGAADQAVRGPGGGDGDSLTMVY